MEICREFVAHMKERVPKFLENWKVRNQDFQIVDFILKRIERLEKDNERLQLEIDTLRLTKSDLTDEQIKASKRAFAKSLDKIEFLYIDDFCYPILGEPYIPKHPINPDHNKPAASKEELLANGWQELKCITSERLKNDPETLKRVAEGIEDECCSDVDKKEQATHSFSWALKQLKKGERVCKVSWSKKYYLSMEQKEIMLFGINCKEFWMPVQLQILANDWVLYEDNQSNKLRG